MTSNYWRDVALYDQTACTAPYLYDLTPTPPVFYSFGLQHWEYTTDNRYHNTRILEQSMRVTDTLLGRLAIGALRATPVTTEDSAEEGLPQLWPPPSTGGVQPMPSVSTTV